MARISDELREWADVHCGEECEEYLGMLADRIDAEMVELHRDAKKANKRTMQELGDWEANIANTVESRIKLAEKNGE